MTAGMVLRWNQNACGPKDLDMPVAEDEDEDGENYEEDGYTMDVLIPADEPIAPAVDPPTIVHTSSSVTPSTKAPEKALCDLEATNPMQVISHILCVERSILHNLLACV